MSPLSACRVCARAGPLPERLHVHVSPVTLRFCRCPSCGSWLQDPFLDERVESEFYDRYPNLAYPAPAWELALLSERVRRIERWHRPGRLLDIGCGRGYLLAAACRRGWDAYGIEPSSQAHTAVLPEVASRVKVSRLEAAGEWGGTSDVITLFHVIEHLREPARALFLIREKLAPGGVLVLSTPNADSLPARLLRTKWAAFRMVDHCVVFTAASLIRLLEACGYSVLHVGAAGQPLALGAGAGSWSAPAAVLRRRGLSLTAHWGPLRRGLRRGIAQLGLGDAMEVYATSGAAPATSEPRSAAHAQIRVSRDPGTTPGTGCRSPRAG